MTICINKKLYAEVIALYFSCPAVSHICALIIGPLFNSTALVANSTPTVGVFCFGIVPFIYLLSKQVLPTAASPTRITKPIQKLTYF